MRRKLTSREFAAKILRGANGQRLVPAARHTLGERLAEQLSVLAYRCRGGTPLGRHGAALLMEAIQALASSARPRPSTSSRTVSLQEALRGKNEVLAEELQALARRSGRGAIPDRDDAELLERAGQRLARFG